MTPAQRATQVEVANSEDVKVAVREALKDANITLRELRCEAQRSQFSSERARMAWFVVSPFVGAARPQSSG
jgi:hypothetical protein